jgi:hypothetical protein
LLTCRKIRRLNIVEKNLSRYLKDDMTTGDHYKDKQREEAYRILDVVGMMCQVDREDDQECQEHVS